MDYEVFIRKITKLVDNGAITEFNVYDVMYLIGTSQYTVAKTVLTRLERLGVLERQGKVWKVRGESDE